MKRPFAIVLMLALASTCFAGVVRPTLESAETPVLLNFEDATVVEILEAIGTVGRVSFVYDDRLELEDRTSIRLPEMSLTDALDFFLRANRMFYVVLDSGTVLVAPDTRQKRQEHMPTATQTYRLEHIGGRSMVTVLRSLLQTRQLSLGERRNSVTMTDTVGKHEIAEEIIARIDRAPGEVAGLGARGEEPLWVGSDYDMDLRTPGEAVPTLTARMARPVELDAKEVKVSRLYEMLERKTGVAFLFERTVALDQVVSITLPEMPAADALDRLNLQLGLFSVVWGPQTVFVLPDDRPRRTAEEHVAIGFFYLTHADTKNVVTAFRTQLQARQLVEVPHLNAVLLRETLPKLDVALELVEAMDVPGEPKPER